MALRWRKNGDLVCAAITEPEEDDCYIGDRLSYQLSVISRCIMADVNHEQNALWHWVFKEDGNGDVLPYLRAKEE